MVPVTNPKVPVAEPILVFSPDTKHSDDLIFASLQPMSEIVITHSFKEDGDSDTSSNEVNMAPRFRTLG